MKRNKAFIIGGVLVLLLVIAAIVGYMVYAAILAPVVKNNQVVYVRIYPDDDMQRVEEILVSAVDFKTMAGFAPLMKR